MLEVGRERLNSVLLLALSGACYALVALCMWVLEKPELGIATFYLVPTCLLALAVGPRGGVAGRCCPPSSMRSCGCTIST